MGKLNELKNIVADAFKDANTKESIETLATINNKIEEAEAEQTSLESKNAELIKSYKDLVQHTSFKNDSKVEPDPVGPTLLSVEDALAQFIENENK